MAPSAQIFGPTIRHTGNDARIALTFDDGPNPRATPRLLEVLARHEARATFFVMGRHVREWPKIVAEIASGGHAIGNHTETHPNLIFCSPAQVRDELKRCAEAVGAATGRRTSYVRPPFGFRGPWFASAARATGHGDVVMWSKWAWDWKVQPAAPVIERLRAVRGGDIVLLHDADHRVLEGDRTHTVEAMVHWLPRWKDAGLSFTTVDEMLGIKHAAGEGERSTQVTRIGE
jgi:peptidoglycan-N-acetylglucosamine deacetylase